MGHWAWSRSSTASALLHRRLQLREDRAVLPSMKTLGMCALALMLSGGVAQAKDGISIKLNAEDSRTQFAPRRELSEARLAIISRDRSTALMVTAEVVAVQLTDHALADVQPKKDAGFLEDLVASGVRLAVGRSVEYPLAAIRSAEYRDGSLRLTNNEGKPVFEEIEVNGRDVLRDFSSTDVARFINAFRAAKARR